MDYRTPFTFISVLDNLDPPDLGLSIAEPVSSNLPTHLVRCIHAMSQSNRNCLLGHSVCSQ